MPIPANGYLYYTKLPDGRFPISTRAYAECKEGYIRSHTQSTCQDISGTWTHPLTCKRGNENIYFDHKLSYSLSLWMELYYFAWRQKICYLCIYFVAVTCETLSIENGKVSYNENSVDGGYPMDTVASFSCNSGYHRVGAGSSTCQSPGRWNNAIPRCNINRNEMNTLLCIFHLYVTYLNAYSLNESGK